MKISDSPFFLKKQELPLNFQTLPFYVKTLNSSFLEELEFQLCTSNKMVHISGKTLRLFQMTLDSIGNHVS